MGLLVVVGAYGYLSRRRWANDVNLVLASLSIGAFVPPLTSDPVVGGAVVLWHLSLLGRWLFTHETTPIPANLLLFS